MSFPGHLVAEEPSAATVNPFEFVARTVPGLRCDSWYCGGGELLGGKIMTKATRANPVFLVAATTSFTLCRALGLGSVQSWTRRRFSTSRVHTVQEGEDRELILGGCRCSIRPPTR